MKTEYVPPSDKSLEYMYKQVNDKDIKRMIVFNMSKRGSKGHAWSLQKKSQDKWYKGKCKSKVFGKPANKSNELYKCGFVLIL